jgi:hypothetical protein
VATSGTKQWRGFHGGRPPPRLWGTSRLNHDSSSPLQRWVARGRESLRLGRLRQQVVQFIQPRARRTHLSRDARRCFLGQGRLEQRASPALRRATHPEAPPPAPRQAICAQRCASAAHRSVPLDPQTQTAPTTARETAQPANSSTRAEPLVATPPLHNLRRPRDRARPDPSTSP